MAMQQARQCMTFEQYLLLVNNSDRHYEYYDGEVRLMAGGTSNSAASSGALTPMGPRVQV